MSSSSSEVQPTVEEEKVASRGWRLIRTEEQKWIPHLYVNNSDYICCYYTGPASNVEGKTSVANVLPKTGNNGGENVAAKLFITSKGPKKFLEAHGLEQWWSDAMELRLAISDSKLIRRQLRSLYNLAPSQGKPQ